MGTKIEIKGQYMNRSTFRTIKYMNGSFFVFVFFFRARYMNGVCFEILARTPVPQLHPKLPPLHATLPEYFLAIAFDKVIILQKIMTFFLFSTKVYVMSRETLLVNTRNIYFVEK